MLLFNETFSFAIPLKFSAMQKTSAMIRQMFHMHSNPFILFSPKQAIYFYDCKIKLRGTRFRAGVSLSTDGIFTCTKRGAGRPRCTVPLFTKLYSLWQTPQELQFPPQEQPLLPCLLLWIPRPTMAAKLPKTNSAITMVGKFIFRPPFKRAFTGQQNRRPLRHSPCPCCFHICFSGKACIAGTSGQ